jgi:hypothetical protein
MVQVRGWTLWCAAWFERSIEQLLEDLQHTPKTSGLRLEQDPTDNSHSSTDNNVEEGERTMRKRLRAEAAEARRRRQEEAKATADKMEIEPHEEIAQSPAPTGIDIVDIDRAVCRRRTWVADGVDGATGVRACDLRARPQRISRCL